MKKRFIAVALILSVIGTSCIGPFNLSHKVLAWNQTVSDNKFVNAILFVVLSPVYGLTLFGDAILFNTIEFWTGDNPIEAGLVKEVKGENGVIYTVETTKNGYNVKNDEGKEVNLVYDKASNTWSYEADGKSAKLITIEGNDKAIVYMPNGDEKQVELSQQGVLAFRQSVENALYYAQR